MQTSEFYIKKIVNDPVYGFINLPSGILYDVIEHPCFQRLRRIKQLGLTHLVYPGANHSRLQHAMGAFHLMGEAIELLRSKGHEITHHEAEAVRIAILLHDAGHGPYSHALENSIVKNINHEELSLLFMKKMNLKMNGALDTAIEIFTNQYPKRFLHQLVSSQLDMDRLDYLKRDSFFTGVSEGVISSDRIIKMLNIKNDQLVVDEKGIYSIEKFLVARRLMYWQVYWHKTVLAAEQMMVMIISRAKDLMAKKESLFTTPALEFFLKRSDTIHENPDQLLEQFALLDDYDIQTAVKVWSSHSDKTLSVLCRKLMNRDLLKINIQKEPVAQEKINRFTAQAQELYKISANDAKFLVFTGDISNNAYSNLDDRIQILYKTGELTDISEASDMLNIAVLSKIVKKYFICYPKEFKNS